MATSVEENPAATADEPMTRKSNITAGLTLVGLGATFLATTMGWISWASLALFWGSFWPLFLVVPGMALLLLGCDRSKVIGGVLLIGLGLVFFSISTGLLPPGSWGYIWPLFLVIPGVALLVGRGH